MNAIEPCPIAVQVCQAELMKVCFQQLQKTSARIVQSVAQFHESQFLSFFVKRRIHSLVLNLLENL